MTDHKPPLIAGQILVGPLFNEPMRVETVRSNGSASWIVGLVGTSSERRSLKGDNKRCRRLAQWPLELSWALGPFLEEFEVSPAPPATN
jgi:hypothetical protein